MELNVIEKDASCFRIQVVGQLWEREDLVNLKQKILNCRTSGAATIILDLARLTFISSEGIGLLVSVHKDMKNDKRNLIVFKPRENVKEIFLLSGLYEVLKIAESEQLLNEIVGS